MIRGPQQGIYTSNQNSRSSLTRAVMKCQVPARAQIHIWVRVGAIYGTTRGEVASEMGLVGCGSFDILIRSLVAMGILVPGTFLGGVRRVTLGSWGGFFFRSLPA